MKPYESGFLFVGTGLNTNSTSSFVTEIFRQFWDSMIICVFLGSCGNQFWIFIGRTDAEAKTPNTLATWCEEPTHWKRPWWQERLKEGGEGDNRGWDGWIASPIRWTGVWVGFRSWWWTGKPGVLQSMGSQRVRHDWATELNWGTCPILS